MKSSTQSYMVRIGLALHGVNHDDVIWSREPCRGQGSGGTQHPMYVNISKGEEYSTVNH